MARKIRKDLGLDEFTVWYVQERRPGFTKETVSNWPLRHAVSVGVYAEIMVKRA